MATFARIPGLRGSSSFSWLHMKKKDETSSRRRTLCCVSSSVSNPYKTLRIHPGASELEVKKAFRRLALQYHPDVCRGGDCDVQFARINEAYDIVMKNLRGESTLAKEMKQTVEEEQEMAQEWQGAVDPEDLWDEWMGWEGAGIRDYSSHINPYILEDYLEFYTC